MMQQRVNFLSPVKIIKNTITLMENGHIAVVASVVALAHGGIDVSAYSSSKHAIYSWINSFRQ
jgi:NAD(P)-dependent dehydrogenase (short-subunit alcohol dehydrogenase family)